MAASKEWSRTQPSLHHGPTQWSSEKNVEKVACGGRIWELFHVAGLSKHSCQVACSVPLKWPSVTPQLHSFRDTPLRWPARPPQRWPHVPARAAAASAALEEAQGAVVFRRHRSQTKFQYATSLEQLALGRLSSPQAQEAALGMGVEKVGENETPVCVGFTVAKEGRGDLRLEGAVDTAIEVPCARCACSVGVPLEGAFNLLLTAQPLKLVGRTVVGIVRGRGGQEMDDLDLRKAERMAGEAEEEAYDLDLDDKKHFPPEASEIDLSDYIRETILLKIPIKVLCHDDCKGLCIDCGADWNKETCSCAQARLAEERAAPKTNWGPALAQLRDRLKEAEK